MLDIEVFGSAIGAIVDGFHLFPKIAMKYLVQYGMAKGTPLTFDRGGWYPQDQWLAAFQAIIDEVGSTTLYSVGLSIIDNVAPPPNIADVDGALRSMDIAYHMNHRRRGMVMFDPTTGMMLEGIGHYGYARAGQERKVVCVCDTPYPCDFDLGIVTSFAQRFEKKAKVVHDGAAPCRKEGADSCTYVIRW